MRRTLSTLPMLVLPILLARCHPGPADALDAGADASTMPPDAGPADAGSKDAGTADAGHTDAGPTDAGPLILSRSNDSRFEGETQIAIAPDGTIAVAWISTTDTSSVIQYIISSDAGSSFGPIGQVATHGDEFASDPALAVDDQGNFFLAWLSLTNNATYIPARVLVAEAVKGAASFGPDVEASDSTLSVTYDHPKIAVTHNGTLMVTVLELSGAEGTIPAGVLLKSSDGQTWNRSVFLDEGSGATQFSNLFGPCRPVTSGDRFFITFFGEYTSGNEIDVMWTDDEGATWSPVKKVSLPNDVPVAAGDPACVAEGSELWVSYGVSTDPLGVPDALHLPLMTGIRLAHSADRGQTFDLNLAAEDPDAGTYYLLPRVTRTRTADIGVIYYAGASDGDTRGTFRGARLESGAFLPSRPIGTPLHFTTLRSSVEWLGDYVGEASNDATVVTSYADNSSGSSHIAFERVNLR